MKAPSEDNLWVAAGDGQVDRVRELVRSGIDINSHDENGYTTMHAAVSYDQKEMVLFLLENKANVNIEDEDKETPLYVAENTEIAKLLVDHGANPKIVNHDGISPAVNAFEEGWDDVAQYLAKVTGEKLPKNEQVEEVEEVEEVGGEEDNEDRERLLDNHTDTINNIMRRIEAQGGIEDEKELQEVVAKMLLEEMQRS